MKKSRSAITLALYCADQFALVEFLDWFTKESLTATTVGAIKHGSTLPANPILLYPVPLSMTTAGREVASIRGGAEGESLTGGGGGSATEIREGPRASVHGSARASEGGTRRSANRLSLDLNETGRVDPKRKRPLNFHINNKQLPAHDDDEREIERDQWRIPKLILGIIT